MIDKRQQAQKALKKYLERGRLALEQHIQEDVDGLLETMRLRTAAFHNFRAIDTALHDQGIDLSTDPAVNDTVEEINVVDAELAKVLEDVRLNVRAELSQNQRVRNSIGKYRSRRYRVSEFERSI